MFTPRNTCPISRPPPRARSASLTPSGIWKLNQDFWKPKNLPLQQEIIFASTGTKKPTDPPDKYVDAFAGSDIQTNPPATNDAVEKLNQDYTRQIDKLPPKEILDEIDQKVDPKKMEDKLMEEGTLEVCRPAACLAQADRPEACRADRGQVSRRRISRYMARSWFVR